MPAPSLIHSLRGRGQPLSESERSYFEPRFGRDFNDVRVHTGPDASESARAVNARAFAFGKDIVFGECEYAPETDMGRHLLAHELVHTIQQEGQNNSDSVHRVVLGDVTSMSIGREFVEALDNYELQEQIEIVRRQLTSLDASSPEYEVARSNLSLLEAEATRRSGGPSCTAPNESADSPAGTADAASTSSSGPTSNSIPIEVIYSLYPAPGSEGSIIISGQPSMPEGASEPSFGWGAASARSLALGGTRGIGNLISPPASPLESFLPLSTRLSSGQGPLGPLGNGRYGVERYVSSMEHLRPRYGPEMQDLYIRESMGQSPWLNQYGIRERDLFRIRDLFRQMSEGGIESLAPEEQALMRTFFQAHAVENTTFASPAMSGTIRPNLSSMEGAAPFLREYEYVVRIEVPESAVGEVNAVLGTGRPQNLVQELEVLVTTDSRGSITNIRPNPTSSLGRAAPLLRWGGRALIVVGAGVSAYRIGTATPEERPRVVGEEAGGWIGGLGTASLATAGCIALGIATEGVGLLLCGLVGGIGGGIGGSYVGGEIGEAVGPNPIERAGIWAVDAYTNSMLESPNQTTQQDAVAIRRALYNDDMSSWIYLLNRLAGY